MADQQACENTDVPLFTDAAGNEVFRTAGGALGINVGGLVIVKVPASWHALAKDAAHGVALPAATFCEGNWSHPDGDGSRIVGWRIPAADVQRMGVDAYRLPGEVVDALAKLAAAGVPGTLKENGND